MSQQASQPLSKCTIINLDNPSHQVRALYNPSKVKVSKQVPWQKHAAAKSDTEMLEFTTAKNQTLSLELFFDGFEQGVNVYTTHIEPLMAMTKADKYTTKGDGGDYEVLRPPFVMVVWGKFPPFKGVIDSLDTDYALFSRDGLPVRATCSVKLTEVDLLQMTASHAQEYNRRRRSAGYPVGR